MLFLLFILRLIKYQTVHSTLRATIVPDNDSAGLVAVDKIAENNDDSSTVIKYNFPTFFLKTRRFSRMVLCLCGLFFWKQHRFLSSDWDSNYTCLRYRWKSRAQFTPTYPIEKAVSAAYCIDRFNWKHGIGARTLSSLTKCISSGTDLICTLH